MNVINEKGIFIDAITKEHNVYQNCRGKIGGQITFFTMRKPTKNDRAVSELLVIICSVGCCWVPADDLLKDTPWCFYPVDDSVGYKLDEVHVTHMG